MSDIITYWLIRKLKLHSQLVGVWLDITLLLDTLTKSSNNENIPALESNSFQISTLTEEYLPLGHKEKDTKLFTAKWFITTITLLSV